MKILRKAVSLLLLFSMALPAGAEECFLPRCREDREELSEKITPDRGLAAPTAAEGSLHWYFKRTGNGSRPPLPPEFSFITEHGGVYLGKDEPVIYLTFDAGYENGNVAKILDVLKEEGVPAAFFVLEHLVTDNTDLIRRMVEEGHIVANHTARHRDMSRVSDEEFRREIEAMEEIYRRTVGWEIGKFYRPPEGAFSRENLIRAQEMGYTTVFWSSAYADWDNNKQPDPSAAAEKLMKDTHNGEILLLHPTSATNAAILGSLIRQWKDMGYRFGSLEELCAH